MVLPPIIILAVIMCGSAVLITAMVVVSFLVAQRRRASTLTAADDFNRRLERIEQIAESTAVEIERLGESNRYLTKLLAERAQVTQ